MTVVEQTTDALAQIGELKLSSPTPGVSNVTRLWMIRVAAYAPAHIWCEPSGAQAVANMSGSETRWQAEQQRIEFLLEWMWDRLNDPVVLANVPPKFRRAWDQMTVQRTARAAGEIGCIGSRTLRTKDKPTLESSVVGAAYFAYRASHQAAPENRLNRPMDHPVTSLVSHRAAAAYDVARATTKVVRATRKGTDSYWGRADLPATLTALNSMNGKS